MAEPTPRVAVLMGSDSDLPVMAGTARVLEEYGIAYDLRVLSAHRSPEETARFAREARARGIQVIIAAAGGAAHLAGVTAAKTTLPVLGVPMESAALKGMDSLLSTVQMPAGVPVATFAIGRAGATNAALFAVAILAGRDKRLRDALNRFRKEQSDKVLAVGDPRSSPTGSAQAGRRNSRSR